jgi:hypothetical protein
MAATVYTTQVMSLAGLDLTALLAAGASPGGLTGDSFVNTGREYFVHINGTASPHTVTFSENACSYGVEHDLLKTTLANDAEAYGPFPTSKFGTSIPVAYDSLTNITVLVIQVPTMS